MALNLNISGYLALLAIEIKSQLVYAFDFIASFIAKLVRPLIMLAVWAAVFLNTKATSIGGFTLTVTTSYFFLMAFMSILIDEDIEEMIQGDVQSGGIASALIKPFHYPFKVLSESLGSYIVFLVAVGLPIFAIMLTFAPLHLTVLNLTLFAIEVVVALVIFNTIGFLIGTLALYFTSVTSIANTVFSIAAMLAGLTIPLKFPSQVHSRRPGTYTLPNTGLHSCDDASWVPLGQPRRYFVYPSLQSGRWPFSCLLISGGAG